MTQKNVTGIVLSSKVFGEADIRAIILCREEGKKTFIFKGLKKSIKRPQSAAEPGTVTKLIYNENKNKELITAREFSVIKYYHKIRTDLGKITVSAFLLELTEKTTGFDHKENKVFELLVGALSALEETEQPVCLAVFFTIHLMRLHGILPPTIKCNSCGKTDFTQFTLDERELKLLCKNCAHTKDNLLGSDELAFLSTARSTKFSEMALSLNDAGTVKLLASLSNFIEHYFGILLRSKDLITSIL